MKKVVVQDTLEKMATQAAIRARAEISIPYPLNKTHTTYITLFEMHSALGKLQKVYPHRYNGLRGAARRFVQHEVVTRCADASSDFYSKLILLEAARFYEMNLKALRAAA